MCYMTPRNYLVAFSFSFGIAAKVSDFQIGPRPVGSEEMFARGHFGLAGQVWRRERDGMPCVSLCSVGTGP